MLSRLFPASWRKQKSAFELFDSRFRREDVYSSLGQTGSFPATLFPELKPFFERYAGGGFKNGIYRVVTPRVMEMAHAFLRVAHPKFASSAQCFAFNWAGCLYCLDAKRMEDGAMAVLFFEPGMGEVLEIPANLLSFHEHELIQQADAALYEGFYQKWLSGGGQSPHHDQCVGYKKPVFLGGKDEVENLEITDLDVYWTLSAQLIEMARGLPSGTRIGKVTIE